MMSEVNPLAWPSSATRTIIAVIEVTSLTRRLGVVRYCGRSMALRSADASGAGCDVADSAGALGTGKSIGPTDGTVDATAAGAMGVTVKDLTVMVAPALVP